MRSETFSRFLFLSVLTHIGVGAALYLAGYLDGGGSRRYTPAGFDLARVHQALERMREAEPQPVAVAVTQPQADPEPEQDVLGLGAKPSRSHRRTSLAPSNLMEILEGEREPLPDVEEPADDRAIAKDPSPSDSRDPERAFPAADPAPGITSSVESTAPRQRASSGRGIVKEGPFAIGGKGEVSRAAYEQVLEKRLPQIENCYQAALLENSGLSGKLLLRWSVSKTGEVEQVIVEKSQLENSELHSCIVQEIAKTQFPKPQGGSIILRFPLMFSIEGQ